MEAKSPFESLTLEVATRWGVEPEYATRFIVGDNVNAPLDEFLSPEADQATAFEGGKGQALDNMRTLASHPAVKTAFLSELISNGTKIESTSDVIKAFGAFLVSVAENATKAFSE